MSGETFVLRGFNTLCDIERIFRKLYLENRIIEKIWVNKNNFRKLKEIHQITFRRDFDKEMKFPTIFGQLPIIIKEGES